MKKATIAKLLVVCLIVSMMGMSIAAAPAPTAESKASNTYEVTEGVYTLTDDTTITDVSNLDSKNGETAINAGTNSVSIQTGTVNGTVAITVAKTGAKGVTVAEGVTVGTGAKLTVDLAGGKAPVVMDGVKLTAANAELTVFSSGTTVLYSVTGNATVTITINPVAAPAALAREAGNTVVLEAANSTFKRLNSELDDVNVTTNVANKKVVSSVEDGYTVYALADAVGTQYAVNVTTGGNGTATANMATAAEGKEVTVTVRAKSGYKFSAMKIYETGDDTNVIANVTKLTNDAYTFDMPAHGVTVYVTFKQSGGGNSSSGGSSTPVKPTDPEPTKPVFTDVAADAYYADAVAWAIEKGITVGLTETTFGPDASCTRGQMVTFLWRLAGSPKATSTNPFGDVSADSYYYDAVMWAVDKGITSGTAADAFSPDATVNRAQSVTFLYRYAGSPAVEGSNAFTDVAADDYYANAVAWAAANGITVGTTDTTFSPDNACVRGQIVTFMYRYAVEK